MTITFGDFDCAPYVDGCIRCIKAVLTNAGVVASLTQLGQVARTFRAIDLPTTRDCMKSHDIALSVRLAATCMNVCLEV